MYEILMKKSAYTVANEIAMVFSRGSRTRFVHLHSEEGDNSYGRRAKCGSVITNKNAHCSTAWEANRERGQLAWCPRRKLRWPEALQDFLAD